MAELVGDREASPFWRHVSAPQENGVLAIAEFQPTVLDEVGVEDVGDAESAGDKFDVDWGSGGDVGPCKEFGG